MVELNFHDFYFFSTMLLSVFYLWVFFFKLNTTNIKTTNDNLTTKISTKLGTNNTIFSFYLYIILYSYIGVNILHGRCGNFWYNHLALNNFTISFLHVFILVGFLLLFLLKSISVKNNLCKSIDYLFSINNLVLFLPILFFSNSIFTFLFFLELISAILLYKLISSKIWFKSTPGSKNLNNNIPHSFINMVFFQYWVTFFSTIFIIYFYINIYYIFGTVEWSTLQYLGYSTKTNYTFNVYNFLFYIFVFSLLLKLGITPLHLYKVEVYKGIPILSVFFYTTYYFVVLFLLFIFILSDLLIVFATYYYTLLCFILFVGTFYTCVLLFDVSLIKAFFTYSTVINTIGFLTIFISNT